MKKNENRSVSDSEWENRTLCSDESCIGVIGPDGRCKECGRLFEGKLPKTSSQPKSVDVTQTHATETTLEDNLPDEKVAADDKEAFATDEEWKNRTLCSDESCIGVIGPGGRCKECGRLFEGQ